MASRSDSASGATLATHTLWAAGVLIGLVAGCGETNTYVEPPPPEVTVATPVTQDVMNYFEATGTAQPVMSVDIRARVKGFLKERLFKEGAVVKKGELLLVIDDESFRLTLDQARTRLAEAEANLTKAKQSRAREVAKAQLALDESQLQLARVAEARQRNLSGRGAGSREEMDQAEANRKKNEAQVESDRASLAQAEADYDTNILVSEANVGAAKTAVRTAEIELGYCRMHAPIDGRISRGNHNVGNLVGDGQASILATIVKTDPIYAYVNVNELDLLRARKQIGSQGQVDDRQEPIEMGLADETGYPHRGLIDYQDPGVDPGTGTIRVRGVFPNPKGVILPGLFVRVRVPTDQQKEALLVPERALGTDQSGQYLLVVGADDVVEYRAVKAGAQVDDLRVVQGKIQPKDRVIVDGLLRARPKAKVKPMSGTDNGKSIAVAQDSPRS
jgi:RND family efflux transporter MFP subunit